MENSDSHYQSEVQDRSTIELVIDQGFLWLTQFFAFGLAAILIWIVVQVTLQAVPAIQDFGIAFLTQSAWNPIQQDYGILPMVYGTLVSSLFALLLVVLRQLSVPKGAETLTETKI